MGVALDLSTESHTGTTGSTSEASFSWSHGASSNVKGVLIYVWNNANQNNVTSVTYGGVDVPAVSGGEAVDSAGEPGRCTAYFLGDTTVPVGTQTVVVNRTNNATVMAAVAITVTANGPTRVVPGSIVLTQGDGTVAEVLVSDNPGFAASSVSQRFAGGHFGHNTPPTAGANSTLLQSLDVGGTCFVTFTETINGVGARAIGGSSATSDDRAIVSLAIAETYMPLTGTLSLTGRAAAVLLSAAMAVGSMGMTGYAPTVLSQTGENIAIPAGSLAYTGTKPTTAFLGPTVGQITFAGQAPTFVITNAPAMGAGALAWHGLAPIVDVPAPTDTTITPGVGVLGWTGYAITLRTGDSVIDIPAGQIVIKGPQRPEEKPQPDVGRVVFTGYAFNIAVDAPGSAITIAAGQLVLAGRAPDRIADFSLSIPVGSLALSGQYVSVAFKQPDCGQLVLTGLAPTVVRNTATISLGAGSLVYTGLGQNAHLVVAMPKGTLAWAAPLMNVATSGNIEIGCGVLAITGTSSTVDLVCAIPSGAITFTGLTPALGKVFDLPVGVLAMQGYAVELGGERTADLPCGVLAWHGHSIIVSTTKILVVPVTVHLVREVDVTVKLTRVVDHTVRWR